MEQDHQMFFLKSENYVSYCVLTLSNNPSEVNLFGQGRGLRRTGAQRDERVAKPQSRRVRLWLVSLKISE